MSKKSDRNSRNKGNKNTLKHDSFTVKKNGEEKVIFHYDRRERFSMPSAPKKDAKLKGIFKGNRSLLILMLDIVIILILMFIFLRFLNKPSYKKTEQGYQFELEAFPYADNILVSLYVKKTGKIGENLGNFIKVDFYTTSFPENREVIRKALPTNTEKESILRAKLKWSGRNETVNAAVDIGSKTIILKKSIKKK